MFLLFYTRRLLSLFFFFNDTATTEIYTLSLHDALPISERREDAAPLGNQADAEPRNSIGGAAFDRSAVEADPAGARRSEEHTSELQSPCNLVCRLLLEKKKNKSSTQQIEVTRPAALTDG